MQPEFLTLADVLRIHRSCIDEYGGDPAVRDMGLLESALAQPRAAFGGDYLHEDLPSMAAAYLSHIVSNHPFVDGNKRTGSLTAFAFIDINNLALTANEKEYEQLTLSVARGECAKSAVIEFFQKHTHKK